jgi:hypothetical protein
VWEGDREKEVYCTEKCFLGVFTKLKKRPLASSCLSVRLSVGMEQLDSIWKDLHEISHLYIFRKSVEVIQVSLKSDKNNGHFTLRSIYIFFIKSR